MAAADWPTHDNKEWQKVIDRAHDLGWPKPEWTKSHPKLVFQCPAKAPQCTLRAFSTGKGTESVAKSALGKVERCPHRNIEDAIVQVDLSLDSAEGLLDAAAKLVLRGVVGERLEELLALASEHVDAAARSLETEFDSTDARFEELTSEAREILGSDPDQTTVETIADAASEQLRSASIVLADLPKKSPEVESRKQRLRELTARRDALRETPPLTS